MARALRVVTVERGVDPRAHALLPFGGAGPLHAAAVADELGMTRIVCPQESGVLSALGLVISERRRDAQRSVLLAGEDLAAGAICEEVDALAARAREELGAPDAELRCVYELRYRGQAHELAVEAGERPAPEELRDAFARAHEDRYGFRDADGEVELITIRVSAALPGPDVELRAEEAAAPERSRRPGVLEGEDVEVDVLRGRLPAGLEVSGPCVCELPEATLLVAPGWSGAVHPSGAVVLER
jgi:N-methylhydantoinase A